MKAIVGKSTAWPVVAMLILLASGWLATPARAQRGATRPRVQMPQGPVRLFRNGIMMWLNSSSTAEPT
jgi:hypothetical protein